MKQVKNWILGGLLAVVLAGIASCAPSYDTASSTNLHRGMVAYGAGDYATAFAEWTPIAEAGDSIAQYFLGKCIVRARALHKIIAKRRSGITSRLKAGILARNLVWV